MNERLRHVFATTLNLPLDRVVDELEYGKMVAEWDSIAHMALVAAIDDEFGIMMETADVIDMSSFARARQLLAKYGVDA